MFDNQSRVSVGPNNPPLNPQNPPNPQVNPIMPNIPPKAPITPTSIPVQQQSILSDEEQREMLRRDKLSRVQKVILIIITFIVLGSLVGGGVWLYITIKPFDDSDNSGIATDNNSNSNVNINSTRNNKNVVANTNTTIDTDSDGLSDTDEKKYGTDINNKDTDGDGYSDGEEVKNGYNPLGNGKL